ncbi:peroxiredoxin Q/BCP [Nitrosomonas cryotolerans]|uniref:thioredoxin-dependent peroxiredoxin n=1 Tax=Nitrosomonas cryotolerans ATCC 49181 TaxID=1131553 RepID=A0A1N6FVW2_9PROT|nr:peroxiredoxin [Nitrosomonas cryotolerans]SFP76162.1 peroxiredoxin Q/BCP [Nitrosomonas cryotolerans]SIN99425.1 peroxiredoxin Q/BCP [Nitrosomonas cryotolerans ATCC 49181]
MEWLAIFIITIVIVFLLRSQITRTSALKPGQPAPDFTLSDQNGKTHTLTDFRGKWLAMYFYPKDDTPGCTKQACQFRDDLYKLTELGAAVVGVSVDNIHSHASFAEKYNLPFPLLADDRAEVSARYRSLINLGIARFAKRNTFLIDPQGKISRIYLSASAADNSAEVIEDLKQLQVQTAH